ncbi:CPBP family intramembrane glutamic endopeptidase [Breznakiellaceae bacterium SP9]
MICIIGRTVIFSQVNHTKRNTTIKTLFEPLIVFFLLFSGGLYLPVRVPEHPLAFAASTELLHLVNLKVPALALVWYLLFKIPGFSSPLDKAQFIRALKPRPLDGAAAAICLFCLCLGSLGLSAVAALFPASSIAPAPVIPAPQGIMAWCIAVLSCLVSSYLEESYFRFYLYHKLALSRGEYVFFSTLLFAACHRYQGLGGTLNAAIAGLLFAVIFTKTKSLHGIAIAHSTYNLALYVSTLFQ